MAIEGLGGAAEKLGDALEGRVGAKRVVPAASAQLVGSMCDRLPKVALSIGELSLLAA